MTQAGFRDIEIYGDFKLTPIEDSESYDAIFVAHKGHNGHNGHNEVVL